MSENVKNLTPYIPRMLLRELKGSQLTEILSERIEGAVLFSDISGFTQLTEELGKKGPIGAEELTKILNKFFGQLIDIVYSFGGDIIKFAGDAAIVVWNEHNIKQSILLATQCAIQLQEKLHNYQATDSVNLKMRIGIGSGNILAASVGGLFGRYEYFIAGDPLVQIGITSKANPGEILISSPAFNLVKDDINAQSLDSDSFRLISLNQNVEKIDNIKPVIPTDMESILRLRGHIPGAILSRLDAGQTAWLAELRRVSILFLNIKGLEFNTDNDINNIQIVMQTLQKSIYKYEGSVNQFLVDDKGTSLLAAFGLPPLTHEDDPLRAIKAGMSCLEELHKLGLQASVGIATGQIFCGVRGNEIRREYAVIGDTVNLAARLMVSADKLNKTILTDNNTYDLSKNKTEFDILEPIQLKGKANLTPIFKPLGPKRITDKEKSSVIGRKKERLIIADQLQKLKDNQNENILIIEGEAGIGKSKLVDNLIQQAKYLDIPTYLGFADAVEKSTPYFAWRMIFNELLHINEETTKEELSKHLEQLIIKEDPDEPDIKELLPLLNPVLPFSYPDTELTEQMNNQSRSDNTRDLLIKLLDNKQYKVVILEDAHWLDSASWSLALLAERRISNILLVIATRPLENKSLDYQFISEQAIHLKLDELGGEEVIELIKHRLNVEELPSEVIQLIKDKAEGHPFFSEEIAYALRDSGLIKIEDTRCILAEGVDLNKVHFPDTVQGVIISRIDRLNPGQQLTLKVASVIGRVFAFETLRETYPIESDKPNLQTNLSTLAKLDITPLDSPEPELSYIFKHIITQEVAYNLMSFDQRKQLHEIVGNWIEKAHIGDLRSHYSLLAYHYNKAENIEKELRYSVLAGKQAASQFANLEAIKYLDRSLELLPEENLEQRYELLMVKERVYYIISNRDIEKQIIQELKSIADKLDDQRKTEVLLREAEYLDAVSLYQQSFDIANLALNLAQHLNNPQLICESMLCVGNALSRQGKNVEAIEILEKASQIAQNLSDKLALQAKILERVANSYWHRKMFHDSITRARQSYALFTQFGDRKGESLALSTIAMDYAHLADYEKARYYYDQALRIAKSIGDIWNEAATLNNIGYLSAHYGKYDEALVYLEPALMLIRQANDVTLEVATLDSLSFACRRRGNYQKALEYAQEAIDLADKSGENPHYDVHSNTLAHCLYKLGKFDQAVDLYQSVNTDKDYTQAETDAGLARIYLAKGELDKAKSYADKILKVFSHDDDKVRLITSTEEPFWILLTCYKVFKAINDARAHDVLSVSYKLLMQGTSTIPDEETRLSYLNNVEFHKEIIDEWNKTKSIA